MDSSNDATEATSTRSTEVESDTKHPKIKTEIDAETDKTTHADDDIENEATPDDFANIKSEDDDSDTMENAGGIAGFYVKTEMNDYDINMDNNTSVHFNVGKTPEICSWCGKSFALRKTLRNHEKIHTGENPYKCDICKKNFIKPSDFLQDKLIHQKMDSEQLQNESEDKMTYWQQFFNQETYRASQQMFEEDYQFTYKEQTFACPIKMCALKTQDILNHLRVDHAFNKKPLLCYMCGTISLRKKAYDRHIVSGHINPPKVVSKIKKCKYCPYEALQSHCIKEHERTHTGERPEMCLWCGKTFACRKTLKNHERLHTGVKPYHCQICDKRFVQRTSLICHNKTHHKPVLPVQVQSTDSWGSKSQVASLKND